MIKITSLSQKEAQFLAIIEDKEMYGLEIREKFKSRFGHQVSCGTLYTTLQRMGCKGLVKISHGPTTNSHGGNDRKYFKIKSDGKKHLSKYRSMMAKFPV